MTNSDFGSLLVVDDNEMNRDMLSRRLVRRGYRVTAATGGADAIAQLKEASFDAVLLDIMMPEVSGWDVLNWIRERYSSAQLPVIMATAKDSSEDVVKALQLGANDYVTKPLDMKVVLARVGTHVILKSTTESLEKLNSDLRRVNQQLAAANERMKEDLAAAAAIQQSYLPAQQPRLEGCDVAWAYKPCDELAGDFLNVFDLNEDNIGMYLLDVVGHGVPAALMSVAVSRALVPSLENTGVITMPVRKGSKIISIDATPPSVVATKLNERFPADPEYGQFFTLVYGIYNKRNRTLTITCAGHPPPAILRADGSLEMPEIDPGFPVGLVGVETYSQAPYTESVLSLQPDDRLCFYSDGVPEAISADAGLFGEKRMRRTMSELHSLPLDDFVRRLMDTVVTWSAPGAPTDDVSILAFHVK